MIVWEAGGCSITAVDPDKPDAAAQLVAAQLAALHPPSTDSTEVGIYLATPDAGFSAAAAQWADALTHSPRFANPTWFAWSLASSLAAQAAAFLGARGPNHTLVGGRSAALAALEHASDDLVAGRIAVALVGAAEMRAGDLAVAAVRLRFDPAVAHPVWTLQWFVDPSRSSMGSTSSPGPADSSNATPSAESPVALLDELIRAATAGTATHLAAPGECALDLVFCSPNEREP